MFIDREAREIMYLVASVRPSVRPLTAEPFKVFVCVSVISWRVRIIARMRLIGF